MNEMPQVISSLESLKNFVGREVGSTGWFTVTQELINGFADLIEDHQWIHVDEKRARHESPYGTTIAHGFLTLALLSRLMREAVQIRHGSRMGVNYGLNRVRFPAPVPAGTNIRAHFSLQSLKEVSNGYEVVFSVLVEAEGSEKPSCIAEWVVRYLH